MRKLAAIGFVIVLAVIWFGAFALNAYPHPHWLYAPIFFTCAMFFLLGVITFAAGVASIAG